MDVFFFLFFDLVEGGRDRGWEILVGGVLIFFFFLGGNMWRRRLGYENLLLRSRYGARHDIPPDSLRCIYRFLGNIGIPLPTTFYEYRT